MIAQNLFPFTQLRTDASVNHINEFLNQFVKSSSPFKEYSNANYFIHIFNTTAKGH